MAKIVKKPEIKVGVSSDGIEQIEVFADTRTDRDDALRTILKVSPQLAELESALKIGSKQS